MVPVGPHRTPEEPMIQHTRSSPRSARRRSSTAALLAGLLALGSAGGALAQDVPADSVIPDLVPKAELPLVPETEVNTSYAPIVPPPSGRTTPALVEVEFEIVENVNIIDPASGAEYETWG
jgi:hypothetical protein